MMDLLVAKTSKEQRDIVAKMVGGVEVIPMEWYLMYLTITITARSVESIEAEVVIMTIDQEGIGTGQGVREKGIETGIDIVRGIGIG